MSRDQDYFNCTQDHELNYVAGLYKESKEVKLTLIKLCSNNKIHYSTHADVYAILDELGFVRA